MFSRKHNRGFTLIEIMVVVVIIGILAAVVVPSIMDRPGQARVAKAKQDIRTLENSLNMYRLDNFRYPTTDQGLEALVNEPTSSPRPENWQQYMPRVPTDPWGNEYHYLHPGEHGEIDIYSLGADGQEGGEGDNADIGNWSLDER